MGVVTIQTKNDVTGQAARIILPLLESPPGSGRYSAHIPPLWPFDGFSTMSYRIYCVEAIAPTADAAGGGNPVTIHGTGFAGVTSVWFGNTPAPRFKVLSSSLIEAVAPPGTGTVNVSVTTRSGTTGGGPLSAYAYISLASISPSQGPSTGSTTVLIRGKDLSQINSLWFGDRPATDLRVLPNNELEALTPPGSGDTAVGIGQLSPLPRDLGVTGSRPMLFFDFGGTGARAGDLRAARLALAWHREAGRAETRSATQGLLVARSRPSLGVFPSLPPPTLTSLLPLGVCATSVGCLCSGPACSAPANSLNWGFTVGDKAWTDATTVEGAVGALLGGYSTLAFVFSGGSLATALAALGTGEVLGVGTFFAAGAGFLGLGLGFIAALAVLATVFATGTSFSVWIDPSGTVSNTVGDPIAGAVAVLGQAPTVDGPFTPVGPASPGIQPHRNPEKTGVDGQFHWDVISDYYKVVASAPGCHAPGDPAQATVSTPALPVPPPQVGLDLVLQCAHQGAPARPLVTSLSSDESLEKGGAQIEIVGSHFTPSATVHFGQAPALSVTFESPELVLASVPPGKGTVNVVVTTEGGTSPSVAAAGFVYGPLPAITNVSPRSGPPAGGTRVTIFGTGLANAQVVRVGRTDVTNFTVTSDQLIELTVPPGGRGPVDITVTTPLGQTALSRADHFTYGTVTAIRTFPPGFW
jgi:IPT/TIG domain/TIG domain